jgi:glutaredoxin
VVVYGRDSCGITRRMREALSEQGTPFEYKIVDHSAVADELHARMQSQGLSTRRYGLPVVDMNGVLAVRPSVQLVQTHYTEPTL